MQTLRITYPPKWWFILVQGIILVGMVYPIFKHQGNGMIAFHINLTWIAFFQGLMFVLGYFVKNSFDKNVYELGAGILYFSIALLSGVILLQNSNEYIYLIAGYLLLNVFSCACLIWNLPSSKMSLLFLLFLLPYTVYLIFLFEMFPSTGDSPLLKLTCFHFIICGMIMIFSAFSFHKMQIEYNKPIKNIYH